MYVHVSTVASYQSMYFNAHFCLYRSDTASVVVTVINLNDNPPQFVGAVLDMIRVAVLEEMPSPYTVLALQVILLLHVQTTRNYCYC